MDRSSACLAFLLILAPLICSAQTFNCHSASSGGATYKLEMQITVSDTIVVISHQDKETIFKRVPSSTGIYLTDGISTNSLLDFAKEGKIKGAAYNHMLTYEVNIKSGNPQKSTLYCWREP